MPGDVAFSVLVLVAVAVVVVVCAVVAVLEVVMVVVVAVKVVVAIIFRIVRCPKPGSSNTSDSTLIFFLEAPY